MVQHSPFPSDIPSHRLAAMGGSPPERSRLAARDPQNGELRARGIRAALHVLEEEAGPDRAHWRAAARQLLGETAPFRYYVSSRSPVEILKMHSPSPSDWWGRGFVHVLKLAAAGKTPPVTSPAGAARYLT